MDKVVHYRAGIHTVMGTLENEKVVQISFNSGVIVFNEEEARELFSVLKDLYSENFGLSYPPGVR